MWGGSFCRKWVNHWETRNKYTGNKNIFRDFFGWTFLGNTSKVQRPSADLHVFLKKSAAETLTERLNCQPVRKACREYLHDSCILLLKKLYIRQSIILLKNWRVLYFEILHGWQSKFCWKYWRALHFGILQARYFNVQ